MERLINKNNVYMNIRNLLESENDTEVILKQLNLYHFMLKYPSKRKIKEKHAEVFEIIIRTYSKIGFYLLTRLTSFQYDEEIVIAGFSLAAYCFEIIAKNGDLIESDVEESKLLSSICYSLANNAANSIVMARSITSSKFALYKLFLERNYKTLINKRRNDSDIVLTAIRKMAYSLIYKNQFEEDLIYSERVLEKLKEIESNEVYYFRLIICVYRQICKNSIRKLSVLYPQLKKYVDILTQKEKVYELWEAQKYVAKQLDDIFDVSKISYISLPTSAGKTLLAEIVLYNFVSQKRRLQLYIVPSLALENEVRNKLGRIYRKVGTVVTNTIEVDEEGAVKFPQIVVATPEKVDNALRRNPEIFNEIDCVVFDEFHKIASGARGWFEEALIIWFNALREKYNYKMVLMSAIADDVQDTLNMDIVDVFENGWSPTRKQYCKFEMNPTAPKITKYKPIKKGETVEQGYDLIMKYPSYDNEYRIKNVFCKVSKGKKNVDGKDSASSDTKADVAWKAVSVIKERPLMVFFVAKPELERFIKKSSKYMEEKAEGERLSLSLAQLLGESHLLVSSLKYGVAYHDGDLPDDVRSIIESEFRKGTIDVIACTSTLADGVNLPAKAMLLANIFYRVSGQDFFKLGIGDYKNIVGRTGRALTDTEGTVYLIKYPEYYYADEIFADYYAGATAKYRLRSALDVELGDYDDEIIRESYLDEYKRLLHLQLLIFTLFDREQDYNVFIEKFSEIQVLRPSDGKLNVFRKYGKRYFDLAKNITPECLRRNVKTGVSYDTNIVLENIAERVADSVILEEVITEEVYLNLHSCVEFNPEYGNTDNYKIFLMWIREESLHNLAEIVAANSRKDKYEETTKYIKKVFQYIAPWMFGCLAEYLDDKISAKMVVDSLCSQVKYGTQDDDVIALCNKGIKSRDLAISISRIYHSTGTDKAVVDWLMDVNDKILYKELVEQFDVSILEQVGRIRRDSTVKSSYFEKVDRVKSRLYINENYSFSEIVTELKTGNITLSHSKRDPFNEFRVDVFCNFKQIGYLPDIISEEVSELLDSDEIINCNYAETEDNKIWIRLTRYKAEV